MCYLHVPIVDNISQVKCRPAVASHYHEIVKLLELKPAKYLIVKMRRVLKQI